MIKRTPAKLAPNLLVVLVYLVLSAAWCARFFSFQDIGSHVMQDGDPALNAWALNWVSRSLTSDWVNLFNGNTFYPHPKSVALSEHMVGLALFNIPIRLLTDNPWVGYNLLIFAAYFFSALGGYFLISYLTKDKFAGFWGGIFWGFCFFRIHHIGHLQILSYQWFPFVALFLIKTRYEPTIKNGLLLTLFFLLQALTSWYLAVIISFLSIVLFAFYMTATRWRTTQTIIFFLSGLIILAIITPFALPYTHAVTDTTLIDRLVSANQLGDQIKLSDFFFPPTATLLGSQIVDNKYWIWQENTLFIGYFPCLLALIGFIFGWKNNKRLIFASVTLILIGYVLSMGHFDSSVNLHLPLYYLSQEIPFLAAIRATQRFVLLTYFGVLMLSGFGMHYLIVRLRSKAAYPVFTVVVALFLFEVYPAQLPWKELTHYSVSSIDSAIAVKQRLTHSKLVVLHYPIYTVLPGYPTRESKYMVDSTSHWAKILNGFSGAEPKGFHKDMVMLNTLPKQEALALLNEYKVDVVALHKELDGTHKQAIKDFFNKVPTSSIEEVGRDEYLIFLNRHQ